MNEKTKVRLKLLAGGLLLAGAIGFVGSRVVDYAAFPPPPGPPPGLVGGAPGGGPGGPGGMVAAGGGMIPPAEERAKMRAQMMEDLGLSPEQQEQIDAIAKKYDRKLGDGDAGGPEQWRARFEEMEAVLTPEQRVRARQAMAGRGMEFIRNHMMQRASVLPPDEQKKFEEKLDERLEEGRRRIQEGGFPGVPGEGPAPPPAEETPPRAEQQSV